jgi:hypothetical protein
MQSSIETCWVYDEKTESFRKDKILVPGQKHILLSLDDEYPEIHTTLPGIHLYQNYPNPFNPETTISFSTTEDTENTEISIYNIKGQRVKSFKIQNSKSNINKVVWDGKDNRGNQVSSGIYFYQIKTEQGNVSRKMLIMK